MKQQEFYVAAGEIRILMRMLTKLMHQEFQEHLDTCGVKITPPHFGVMRLLKHHPYTIKELSKHMLVEPASLVPIVDELERQAYVRRTTDPQDRRRTPLILTAAGDKVVMSLPLLPLSTPFMRTLQEMGEHKMIQLLSSLRDLACGMSQDEAMVSEVSKSVQLQVSAQVASLNKKAHAKQRA